MNQNLKSDDKEVESLPSRLDTCCGKEYSLFEPSALLCNYSEDCVIGKYEEYYSYEDKYNICHRCIHAIEGDSVTLSGIDLPEGKRKKHNFRSHVNSHRFPEPRVQCVACGNIKHAICVLHLHLISPDVFICDTCLKTWSIKRAENKYTNSQNLYPTKLSSHIEARVGLFLQWKEATSCMVHIRVVSDTNKMVHIPQYIKDRFAENNQILVDMPYRCKVILAFQQIDGVDVCFFAMIVQEYDSDCPAPNTRTVYISYIDSVNFFTPKEHRSDVYHEILLGYLEYVKKLGYTSVHIWSSVPGACKNYLFNCRPKEQKLPNNEHLKEWYKRILSKAILEGTVVKYNQNLEANKQFIAAFPYFSGHFWKRIIDEALYKLFNKKEQRLKKLKTDVLQEGNRGVFHNSEVNDGNNDLTSFIDELIHEVPIGERFFDFFIIQLNSYDCSLATIIDPDCLNVRFIAEDRLSLLLFASQRHLEYNSLRKAKYSTMIMIYYIIHQYEDHFMFTCNMCKKRLTSKGRACKECHYFNLCSHCFKLKRHPHQMVNFDFSPPRHEVWPPHIYNVNLFATHPNWITKHMLMLYHGYYCINNRCKFTWCSNVRHSFKCKCEKKSLGGCNFCHSLINLCSYHANNCTQVMCSMPYCRELQVYVRKRQDNTLLCLR